MHEINELLLTLSHSIARDIMKCGEDKGMAVHRIQFMSGVYPDKEIPMGGLCEVALASVIYESLRERLTAPER